jgi:hypothetical protein
LFAGAAVVGGVISAKEEGLKNELMEKVPIGAKEGGYTRYSIFGELVGEGKT